MIPDSDWLDDRAREGGQMRAWRACRSCHEGEGDIFRAGRGPGCWEEVEMKLDRKGGRS